MKAFIDTETCGLHGMAVTLQYAIDDGPIKIHEFWQEPMSVTLKLIEEILKCEIIGFNLAFDFFHLCKIYTTFDAASEVLGPQEFPAEYIDFMPIYEKMGRDGPSLKPKAALDLMLHARKTEFQMTMERADIRSERFLPD